MKFTIAKENLVTATEIVSPAISNRDIIPVLQDIRVMVGEKMMTLNASNSALSIQVSVPAVRVVKPGTVLIPGNRVVNLAKRFRSEFIKFMGERTVRISAGQSSSTFRPGQPPDQFPEFPKWKENYAFDHQLVRGLERVAVSITKDRTRYALDGVLLRGKKKIFTLTACNNLTVSRVVDIPGPDTNLHLTLPSNLVREIIKFHPGNLLLQENKNQVGADMEVGGNRIRLAHLKIAQKFPDLSKKLNKVKPGTGRVKLSMLSDDLKFSCNMAPLVNESVDRVLTLHFKAKEGIVEMRSRGKIQSQKDVSEFKGKLSSDLTIVGGPEYFADFLSVIHTEWFRVEIFDEDIQLCLSSTPDHHYYYSTIKTEFHKAKTSTSQPLKPLRSSKKQSHKSQTDKSRKRRRSAA